MGSYESRFGVKKNRISLWLPIVAGQTQDMDFAGPFNPIRFDNSPDPNSNVNWHDESGGAYNSATGLFTAPRDGNYLFQMRLEVESDTALTQANTFGTETRINQHDPTNIGNTTSILRWIPSDGTASGDNIECYGSCVYRLYAGDTMDFVFRGSGAIGTISIVGNADDMRVNFLRVLELPLEAKIKG